jgi:hypothetical protein
MIPLMKQIEEAHTQLQLLNDGDENNNAIKAYEIFINKFVPVIGKLEDACNKRSLLKAIPIDMLQEHMQTSDNMKDGVTSTSGLLKILEDKWNIIDYKITQDDSLDNCVQSIKTLTKLITDTNKLVWQTWSNQLFDSFNITDAELSSIEHIDKYKVIYTTFKNGRTSFKEKTLNLPTEVSQIDELQVLANQLQLLIKDIDFDIPEEVKVFFDHIYNPICGNKAPLTLLTPEVLQWIESNNESANFSVGRSSGKY